MGDPNEVWQFEVIRLEVGENPPRVLEEGHLMASQATAGEARSKFIERYEDPKYTGPHQIPRPEAVRFLDGNGVERLRYTTFDYYKEKKAPREKDGEDAHRT